MRENKSAVHLLI
jgi:hypothetical protein